MRTTKGILMGQKGSIVIFVLFMLALLAAIPFAFRAAGLSRKTTNKVISKDQARDIARGGILDATHWFRRQLTQPIASVNNPNIPYPDAAFAPDASNNASGGSIEPQLGLVKEYEFDPEKNIWARHEVRRQAVDNVLNPSATDRLAAHDITALRIPNGVNGQGRVWSLVSRGIVFQRIAAGVPFDQPPNRILSESFAYSEIKTITVALPANSEAAIVSPDASQIQLKQYTTVDGSGSPPIRTFNNGFVQNNAVLIGNIPVQVDAIPFPMATEDIMGVKAQDVLVMSDLVIGTKMLQYPISGVFTIDNANGDNSLFYVNGKLYANSGGVNVYLSQGSGILFLDGPVRLSGQFRGLIIVNQGATVTLYGSTIGGAIYSNGTIISGTDANGVPSKIDIVYNATYVQNAINANNNYREVRSSFLLGADQ